MYAVGDREVKVFEPGGRLSRHWNTAKPGQCVSVTADGRIHVGEDGQVESYDGTGTLLTTFRDGARLGLVTAVGRADDCLLLADAAHRCIRRYDKAGKWLNDIGTDNNTRGFLMPNGRLDFAVDANGVIHVAHPAKFRVERYAADGKRLGHFGKFGTRAIEDFPGCCNPTSLALMSGGRVVVAEKAPARVKVFDAAGRMLAFIGAEAFDQNSKNMPVAVGVAGKHLHPALPIQRGDGFSERIYVGDTARLHICVFEPEEAAATGPAATPADRVRP